MGQEPSSRTLRRRKSTPFSATASLPRPIAASAIVTNEVSGVASRKPPPSGWISRNRRCVFSTTARRQSAATGFPLTK